MIRKHLLSSYGLPSDKLVAFLSSCLDIFNVSLKIKKKKLLKASLVGYFPIVVSLISGFSLCPGSVLFCLPSDFAFVCELQTATRGLQTTLQKTDFTGTP